MSLGGGSQKSTSTTTSIKTLPSWLQGPLQNLVTDTSTLADKPYDAYAGQRIQGFSPDELQAFDMTRGIVGQYQPQLNESFAMNQEVGNRGLNGFSQQTLDQYMNPYIQNVMDVSRGRALDQFDRQRNSLQDQAGQVGAFGGSRTGLAEQQMYDDFSRQLQENETTTLASAYENAQNRAFQGTQLAGQSAMDRANLAKNAQGMGLQDIQALGSAGQQQRLLDQAGLDISYEDYLTEQAYPYQQIQFENSILSPIANFMTGETSTQVSKQSSGGSGLGKALGIASLVAAPFTGGASLGLGGLGGAAGAGGFLSSIGSAGAFGLNTGGQGLFSGGLGNIFGAMGGAYGPGFEKGGQVKKQGGSSLVRGINSFLESLGGNAVTDQEQPVVGLPSRGPNKVSQEDFLNYLAQWGNNPNPVQDPIGIDDNIAKRMLPELMQDPEFYTLMNQMQNFKDKDGNTKIWPNGYADGGKVQGTGIGNVFGTIKRMIERSNAAALPVQPQMEPQAKAKPVAQSASKPLAVKASNPTQQKIVSSFLPGDRELAAQNAPASAKKESEWNMPLLNFGAALLSSQDDFFTALGQGVNAYTATKKEQEIAVSTAEKEIQKMAIEKAKLAIMQQNANAATMNAQNRGTSDPYTLRLKQLQIANAEKRLNGGGRRDEIMDLMASGGYGSVAEAAAALNDIDAMTGDTYQNQSTPSAGAIDFSDWLAQENSSQQE